VFFDKGEELKNRRARAADEEKKEMIETSNFNVVKRILVKVRRRMGR